MAEHPDHPAIDLYRVQQKWGGHPWWARRVMRPARRVPVRPWARTWQAEWDDAHCAPRAFTERGIRRRSARLYRHRLWAEGWCRFMVWRRTYITARGDDYYRRRRSERSAAMRRDL